MHPERAANKEIYDSNYSEFGACQCLWFNKNIRSKSKQYFYYNEWCDKGILYNSDLLSPPLPGAKLFEELILDFGVSHKDRRKYHFLMKNVPSPWLQGQKLKGLDIFERLVDNLISIPKVSKHAYSILMEKCIPDKRVNCWQNLVDDPEDLDWEVLYDTRLIAFYFKVFTMRLL